MFNYGDISYIFRYADKEDATPDSPTEERSDPPQFAETCMRELIGRASFGHIRCVIRPVLRYRREFPRLCTLKIIYINEFDDHFTLLLIRHLDNHHLWVPNYFAIYTFRIIMFSIQVQ